VPVPGQADACDPLASYPGMPVYPATTATNSVRQGIRGPSRTSWPRIGPRGRSGRAKVRPGSR